ncbi:MAG: cytochrome d ubiquinol oxidase subunit II [Myxococcota bacterium]|jgi:cytochrome d ubiquinol oxidase subunit II|nr:cytochrome d ubiquinol oxidase subunit II [Myxococcota bacterium]
MDLNLAWFLLFFVLIAGYAILDGYDLGVGILSLGARGDLEQRLHLNAIGPVWDGNEVWLITAGGALFAAFPPVYATVFSGLYLALVLLLLALILRAVSFEFRSKVEHPGWRRAWDLAFGLGSLGATVLFGVAVGNILRGLPLDPRGEFAGTFLGLLNPYALGIGLLTVVMFVVHGALYLAPKGSDEMQPRLLRVAARGSLVWAALYLTLTVATALGHPDLFAGGLGRPAVGLGLVLTVGGLIGVPVALRQGSPGRALLASSLAIAGHVALGAVSLFPNLVPALGTPERSLTLYNSASTPLTLTVMLVIALVGMPIVIGYTIFVHRIFRGKVVIGEHSY